MCSGNDKNIMTLRYSLIFLIILYPFSNMSVGSKIKKIRELRNYTQEYMADRLQMSQSGYSKIETDEVDVNFQKLEQIATILEIKVLDLVGFDEKMVINNYSSNQGYIIHTQVSTNEQKLYEDKIKLLEEKIAYLQETVSNLKNQLNQNQL
jgi:transcriptional regulator with XRE-family HTH domain